MLSTVPGNEVALPPGAALLSVPEQDRAGGGSAYYDLFFWIGFQFGVAEYGREELLVATAGAEYYFL